MSASDNLSNELFFEVHRGVNTSYPHYPESGGSTNYVLDKANLGTHWSASEQVAKEFANSPRSRAMVPHWRTNYGRIIHGELPMSSMETDNAKLREGGVLRNSSDEKEVTAQKGATVRVTGVTKLRQVGDKVKTRKRTYRQPREMKA